MSGGFRLAGVIGFPVRHSLSPVLHGYWLRREGIQGAYVPLAAYPEELTRTVESMRSAGFMGLNITAPHKQSACALAHGFDDAVRKTGAANLLLFANDRIEARNTDIAGLRENLLEEFGPDAIRGKIAVLLGAGGAARAAVLALAALGACEIRIVGRSESRARALGAELGHVNATLISFAWKQWSEAARDAGLLVNATSGGMWGAPALELSLEPLAPAAAVYDLVYNPLETDLLKQARARGHRAANGLGMLIRQAVPAFAAFYGVTPTDLCGARAALEKALAS